MLNRGSNAEMQSRGVQTWSWTPCIRLFWGMKFAEPAAGARFVASGRGCVVEEALFACSSGHAWHVFGKSAFWQKHIPLIGASDYHCVKQLMIGGKLSGPCEFIGWAIEALDQLLPRRQSHLRRHWQLLEAQLWLERLALPGGLPASAKLVQ